MPSLDQPYALATAMKQAKSTAKSIEGKVQEGIGNMTGDLKTQTAEKTKQFEANTQEAILESLAGRPSPGCKLCKRLSAR